MFKRVTIGPYEKGLYYVKDEFLGIFDSGTYHFLNPFKREEVIKVSLREPFLFRHDLDQIIASGALEGRAEVIEIKRDQRALLFIDERFYKVLSQGVYAVWKEFRRVRVDVTEIASPFGVSAVSGKEFLCR